MVICARCFAALLILLLTGGGRGDLVAQEGVQVGRTLAELTAAYPDFDSDGIPYNDGWAGEIGYGYHEYLPGGYEADDDRLWPLIIWLHGAGELGDGNGDLDKALKWGPAHEIAENGQDYPAVIITPQSAAWFMYEAVQVDRLITFAIEHYRVDPRRVSVAGLCSGAAGVLSIASLSPHRLAAIAPAVAQSTPYDEPYPAGGQPLVGLPTWVVHSFGDRWINRALSINWVDTIAAAYPPVLVGSTDCMATYPHRRNNTRRSAGRDMTARFRPETGWQWVDGVRPGVECLQFTLYSDSQHNSWQRTITNPTFLHWLFAQRLQGPFGQAPVTIPGAIEAEHYDHGGFMRSYSDSDGINTGNSTAHAVPNDIDGVPDDGAVDLFTDDERTWIGDIVTEEWVEWTIDVPVTAAYDLQLVVAADSTGGACVVGVDGESVASFTIPDTAGAWVTLAQPVALSAGISVLRLQVTGGGFRLDRLACEGAEPASELVIDNDDPERVERLGGWGVSSATSGYFGADYLSIQPGTIGAQVRYRPLLARAGLYDVYAWYPASPYYGVVPVEVIRGDGAPPQLFSLDQSTGGGQWTFIATVPLSAGAEAMITLQAEGASGFSTVADALRLVAHAGDS